MRTTLANTFWILCLAIVALWAFFLALGAFKPGEVAGVSAAVGGLVVLWIIHAFWQGRHGAEANDPSLIRARERRGF